MYNLTRVAKVSFEHDTHFRLSEHPTTKMSYHKATKKYDDQIDLENNDSALCAGSRHRILV